MVEAGQPRKAVEGEETEQHLLELMSYRACYDIFKWVYSAAANANHNKGLNETSLITLTDKGLLGSFIS